MWAEAALLYSLGVKSFFFYGWNRAVPTLLRKLAPCRHTCVSVRPLTHVQPPPPQKGIVSTIKLPLATCGIQTSWGSVGFNPPTILPSLLERHSWGPQPEGVCWFILAHTYSRCENDRLLSGGFVLGACVFVSTSGCTCSLHFFQLPQWSLISPLNPQHLVLILSWGCFSKQFISPGTFSFPTICCTATNGKNHQQKHIYIYGTSTVVIIGLQFLWSHWKWTVLNQNRCQVPSDGFSTLESSFTLTNWINHWWYVETPLTWRTGAKWIEQNCTWAHLIYIIYFPDACSSLAAYREQCISVQQCEPLDFPAVILLSRDLELVFPTGCCYAPA